MLKVYNSSKRIKEEFVPIIPGKITMYVCGMTTYDHCHIGHARLFLSFDSIIRYLKFRNFNVVFIRNITDIDDKIINKAIDQKCKTENVSKRFIRSMREDFKALGMLKPTHEPKVTDFIPSIIKFILILIKKNFAYAVGNGDVYYDIKKNKHYGSRFSRRLMIVKESIRIKHNKHKKNNSDFVLWKNSKDKEPSWKSPWGNGRPGWHIECSVMSMNYLGKKIDIHAGGVDLMFPHHENECAQSESLIDDKFVNTWMHGGILKFNNKKVSKSTFNLITIKKILSIIHPEVFRFFVLSRHYRTNINYSIHEIKEFSMGLRKLYLSLRDVSLLDKKKYKTKKVSANLDDVYLNKFIRAMNDDFNTPIALSVLFELVKCINTYINILPEKSIYYSYILVMVANSLGLLYENPNVYLKNIHVDDCRKINAVLIDRLIEIRNTFRIEKKWSESDLIRLKLCEIGIKLEDKAKKTLWRTI